MSDQANTPAPTFALTYQFRAQAHTDPLTHEQAEALAAAGKCDSACDCILMMTLSFPPGGGVKGHGFGVDGRVIDGAGNPGPMNNDDKFRAWAHLTAELNDASDLSPDQENVIRDALTGIMAMIAARQARAANEAS